jgi:hypothetical protein
MSLRPLKAIRTSSEGVSGTAVGTVIETNLAGAQMLNEAGEMPSYVMCSVHANPSITDEYGANFMAGAHAVLDIVDDIGVSVDPLNPVIIDVRGYDKLSFQRVTNGASVPVHMVSVELTFA